MVLEVLFLVVIIRMVFFKIVMIFLGVIEMLGVGIGVSVCFECCIFGKLMSLEFVVWKNFVELF